MKLVKANLFARSKVLWVLDSKVRASESLQTGGNGMIILLSAKGTCPTQHDKVIHFRGFFLFFVFTVFFTYDLQ